MLPFQFIQSAISSFLRWQVFFPTVVLLCHHLFCNYFIFKIRFTVETPKISPIFQMIVQTF